MATGYDRNISKPSPEDFENAIDACGFGAFNLILLISCLPGLVSTVFDIFSIAYVLPAADCDLHLTLMERASLHAITFAGIIIGAIPYGFVSDYYSRKLVLIFGLVAGGLITLCSAISQTLIQLIIFKFFGGIIFCGPASCFVSYITEFHGKKHRIMIGVVIGCMRSLASTLLPLIASFVLSQQISLKFGRMIFNEWNLLISITAIPALLSAFLIIFLPESPKFLIDQGNYGEALRVLRKIYSINNCGKHLSYPSAWSFGLRSLRRTSSPRFSTIPVKRKEFVIGCNQFRMLCTKDYMGLTLKTCIMMSPLLSSMMSFALWQPLFVVAHWNMKQQGLKKMNFCDLIEYTLNTTTLVHHHHDITNTCNIRNYPFVYYENMIIALSGFGNFLLTTCIVRSIGNNNLLRIYLLIAGLAFLLKFIDDVPHHVSLFLSCVNSACAYVCVSLVQNTILNVYPTSKRTMSLLFLSCCGRLGGFIGNLLLPLLMTSSCHGMIAFYGGNYIVSLLISYFLPNTTEESLK